jgi:hypothetical protein
MLLTHRIRQQAGSYRSEAEHRLVRQPGPLWETSEVTRAANAVCQSLLRVLTHRICEQAHSYRSRVWTPVRASTRSPVGDVRGYEGRECGGPVAVDVADPPHSRASSLPQVPGLDTGSCVNPDPAGAVRGYEGRECGGSFDIFTADPPHSPASRRPRGYVQPGMSALNAGGVEWAERHGCRVSGGRTVTPPGVRRRPSLSETFR